MFDLPVAVYCPIVRGNLSGPHFDLFDKGSLKNTLNFNSSGLPELWAHAWSAWFGNMACDALDVGRAELS